MKNIKVQDKLYRDIEKKAKSAKLSVDEYAEIVFKRELK